MICGKCQHFAMYTNRCLKKGCQAFYMNPGCPEGTEIKKPIEDIYSPPKTKTEEEIKQEVVVINNPNYDELLKEHEHLKRQMNGYKGSDNRYKNQITKLKDENKKLNEENKKLTEEIKKYKTINSVVEA